MVVNIDPDLSTIENLVGLIQDHLAPIVREIHFTVTYDGHLPAADEDLWDDDGDGEDGQGDGQSNVQENNSSNAQEEEGDDDEPPSLTLSPENTDYLRFLLAKFPNLKAIGIGADEVEEGYEYEQQVVVNRMFPQILSAVASLQGQNVVGLTMPVESLTNLSVLLTLTRAQAKFRIFMLQLRHLSLITLTDQVINDPLTLEDPILNAAPELLSLEISDNCVLEALKRPPTHRFLQLKTLDLSYVELDSHDLLDLLVRSKDTIKYVSFEYVILMEGSWLHVLIQMRKNLKLLELYFMRESMDSIEHSTEGLFFENIPLPPFYILHALGDLQRQINANRIEAGLEPFTTEIFEQLNLQPLSAILLRGQWETLDSRTWDFVEDGNI